MRDFGTGARSRPIAAAVLAAAMLHVSYRELPHGIGLAPVAATAGAAGLDLRAALPAGEPLTLAPRQRAVVPTGIALALPDGHEGQVRPRSGLAASHGVTVLNGPGTVDADYRGEVKVILINHGDAPFTIARGDRIAQLVVAPVTVVTLVAADVLPETVRGAAGFGSTGR